jgi:hypothetical protein
MASYIFEHEGNRGLLNLTTHDGRSILIECHKDSNQIFKIGGTAADSVLVFPGHIISIDGETATVQSAKSPSLIFSGKLYLPGAKVGDIAFAIEYYDIHMEGKPPSWLISPAPIEQSHILFINVECLDAGRNLVRRYRVSPFTGECRMMEFANGT